MSYATLLHGEPDEVADVLEHGTDATGTVMALQNAFRRLGRLEAQRITERERFARIVESEHLGGGIDDESLHPCDLAYNRALKDAAAAIREA
jgi:hypothetical protein